jgi:hypothetical protein
MDDEGINFNIKPNPKEDSDEEDGNKFPIKEIIFGILILVCFVIGLVALILVLTKSGVPGPAGTNGVSGSVYGFDNGTILMTEQEYVNIENISNQYVKVLPHYYASTPASTNNSIILGKTQANWDAGTRLLITNLGSISDYKGDIGTLVVCSGCKSTEITNCSTGCVNNDPIYSSVDYGTDGSIVNNSSTLARIPVGASQELIIDTNGYVTRLLYST